MFQFLGSLFGTSAAGERIVDGVANAADKLFYTDEEKAEAAAAARTEGYQVYMKWLESTSGSRIARRLLALSVTGVWMLEHIASVGFHITAIFSDSPDNPIKAAEALSTYANNNNSLVGVVLLFYFGGPAATDAARGLVEKWASRKQ